MQTLLHALHVETFDMERWEEELTASGACNTSGVVDVKHFVTFCLQGGVEGTCFCHRCGVVDVKHFVVLCLQRCFGRAGNVLGVFSRLQQQIATNTNRSEPLGRDCHRDTSLLSKTMSTTKSGKQIPLPSLADQAGAVVVVESKQYVLGERLGRGAGGS
eukprot:5440294-Amphidinium_carterae.1